jgi:hypothetical protein
MVNLKSLLFLLSGLVYSFSAYSQHTNFNTQRNWSLNKKDLLIGFGATQFTGDLGGRNRIGTDYSLADIDFPSTSFNFMLGYRYRFHPYFATTTSFNIGRVKGDDALTNEIVRESRNLHFRSILIEFSQRLDIILYANEKFGARYNLPGHNGAKNHNEQIYLFAGVGGCYFNPEAMMNNKWYKLDPLNTEGQGMDGGARETLPFTVTVPMGIGLRMGLGRMWRIGIEASYVKTFSDYIDDVSTVYYNPQSLSSAEAQYFSNPSVSNVNWFAPGQQRGDKQKDAYYHLNMVVARNITYKDYAKQRRSYKYPKGRYKY